MRAEEVKGNLVNQLPKIETKEEVEYAVELLKDFLENHNSPQELLLLRTRVAQGEPTYVSIIKNKNNYSNYVFAMEIVKFLRTDEYLKEFGELKLIEKSFDYLEIWFNNNLFILSDVKGFLVEL